MAENPAAAAMQKSTLESYVTAVTRLITGLQRFTPKDGRAEDAVAVLGTALGILNSEFYPATELQAARDEEAAANAPETVTETVDEAPAPHSPGVDSDGDPLPPFSQMTLPSGN